MKSMSRDSEGPGPGAPGRRVHCPDCLQPIPPRDVHADLHMAVCLPCGAVHSLQAAWNTRPDGPKRAAPVRAKARAPTRVVAPTPPKELLGLLRGPRGLAVVRSPGGEVTLRRRGWPPTRRSLALLPIALLWDAGLAGIVYLGLQVKDPGADLVFGLMGVAHLALAVVITAAALRRLFRSPTLCVGPSGLEVFSGAPRGRPDAHVSRASIRQLFVAERGFEGFCVVAHHRGGSPRVVLPGLTVHQAVFVEKYVESLLEIENRPVSGEHMPLSSL